LVSIVESFKEEKFHLVIVDFNSTDMDVEALLKRTTLT
jgi:hypothetical protein